MPQSTVTFSVTPLLTRTAKLLFRAPAPPPQQLRGSISVINMSQGTLRCLIASIDIAKEIDRRNSLIRKLAKAEMKRRRQVAVRSIAETKAANSESKQSGQTQQQMQSTQSTQQMLTKSLSLSQSQTFQSTIESLIEEYRMKQQQKLKQIGGVNGGESMPPPFCTRNDVNS
ncbi:MAG: hypothetical protein EZS28_014724, partial [Streblomastix strix]